MARKLEQKPASNLEDIMEECLQIAGIETSPEKSKLLLRLIISGIADYYFFNPDHVIDVGFIRFEKSPEKNELFKTTILRNKESGVVNAQTLWRYYKGELQQEAQFKEVLDNFLKELIEYSQSQEIDILKLTSKIHEQKRRN